MKTTNTLSEYDQQAETFLATHGLKFRATLSDSKTPAWSDGEKCGHHYRVTISRAHAPLSGAGKAAWEEMGTLEGMLALYQSRRGSAPGAIAETERQWKEQAQIVRAETESFTGPSRLVFDYWSSISDAEKGIVTVKPYDVLACISTDAYTPATFADFCAEYGYEEDSIKALQMFRRCDRFAKRLRDFFTEQELADLSSIN